MTYSMRPSASQAVQHTLEAVLLQLLDHLTPENTPLCVSLCVGRADQPVRLAQATRDRRPPTPTDTVETSDWPLEAKGEPAGFLRFALPVTARERMGTTPWAAITARHARHEPRVSSLVGSLTDLATLAEYLRDADQDHARQRSRAA